MRRTFFILTLAAGCTRLLPAAEQNTGATFPFTLSGGVQVGSRELSDTHRITPHFRAVFYPSVNFGRGLFMYSAVQFASTTGAYGGPSRPPVDSSVLRAYLGYAGKRQHFAFTLKAGQLSSIFGSFPLRYDDMENPLINPPPSYRDALRLRPDQLPCGVKDFLDQWRQGGVYQLRNITDVRFRCGGSPELSGGLVPASLRGRPGTEVDVTTGRFDLRLQFANSSPVNPLGLASASQAPQLAAGGGYTIRQGFRAGLAIYRGSYLDEIVAPLLPAGTTVRQFPARGLGIDVQWAQGPWSLNAEWQQFRFPYPRILIAPRATNSYVELKSNLGPRFYAAGRASLQQYNRIADARVETPNGFLPNRQIYEFVIGYRPNRHQLLKVGYEAQRAPHDTPTHRGMLFVQLVTSIYGLGKGLY